MYAAVGMAALAACGPLRLGAAAIYGGQRVTQSTLTSEVSAVTANYHADQAKGLTPQYSEAQIPNQVLSWILRFATMRRVAASHGVTVTPAQAQSIGAALGAQARQNKLTLDQYLAQGAVPPDLLVSYELYAYAENRLLSQLGDQSTQAGQTASQAKLTTLFCQAARSLDISVNPQYGAFSYKNFQVEAIANPLAAPVGGSSLPAASSADFKPAC